MTRRKPPALTAHRALAELLRDLDDDGRRVPCAGSDRPISEDPDEREFVALAWCPRCPVAAACLAAGEHERWGVWGALDRTPPTATSKEKNR